MLSTLQKYAQTLWSLKLSVQKTTEGIVSFFLFIPPNIGAEDTEVRVSIRKEEYSIVYKLL